MVKSAVADIIGPAVAAEDPLAAGRDEVPVDAELMSYLALVCHEL